MLVRLSGEFDVRYQRILEDTLSDCLDSGRPALVDLSGVTFMDSRCIRELAIHYRLGEGRVALCDPSREVELSVAACDLESWIDFIYTTPGDPAGDAAASVLQEAAIKTEERNWSMRTPYTAASSKESGGRIRALEECAGYVVCDPRRQRIGRAERFFLNASGEPEYIRVKTGLFGFKRVLIPVQTVAVDEERRTLVLQ